MSKGIILVALGYPLYGTYALNLAMSIKAYDSIPIMLIHDKQSIAHLTKEEKALFDTMQVADEADYTVNGQKQYQRMKLCAYKYSPFDQTLYMDVDNIMFPKKKVSDLLVHLDKMPFFIGLNGHYNPLTRQKTSSNYTYWEEPRKIAAYYNLRNKLPQTVSGMFYFAKGAFCEKIFARALEIYNDPKAPCIAWANGKPDEFCFNVALSESNYNQQDSHLVYFDKINGIISRQAMYNNFWGLAVGGNKLDEKISSLYDELVDLFSEWFGFKGRHHIQKFELIPERNKF